MKSAVAVLGAVLTLGVAAQAQDWTILFDGTSLDQWNIKPDGWEIQDGVMALKAKGGYAWSKAQYDNFELELEFKLSPECNSGVFIRSNPGNPVQGGFEIQVLDSHGKENPDKHDCGALYDSLAPKTNAVKAPGEWNKMVIKWVGARLAVDLNGQRVIDANIDDWATPGKNPDGSGNKFKTALKDLPRTGCIGLQDHGKPVWYRNVRVRPIGD